MNKIKINDINFSALQKLNHQGTQSLIYTDGNICYKILHTLYKNEKEELFNKFLEMEGITLNNVLLPIDIIIENDQLIGYTMKYFKNSTPLSNKYSQRYLNCHNLFEDLNKASNILRNLHNNGIICRDLSFENILIDQNNNIMFTDIDGYSYKNYDAPFISLTLNKFLIKWRKSKIHKKEDIDNLSMILSLYLIIYNKYLQQLSNKQYNSLKNKLNTLTKLDPYKNILLDKKQTIYDLPYLDEIIDLNDNYIIDREKQLNLIQKLLYK